MSDGPSFFLADTIPLSAWTTSCVSPHPAMDSWVVFTSRCCERAGAAGSWRPSCPSRPSYSLSPVFFHVGPPTRAVYKSTLRVNVPKLNFPAVHLKCRGKLSAKRVTHTGHHGTLSHGSMKTTVNRMVHLSTVIRARSGSACVQVC